MLADAAAGRASGAEAPGATSSPADAAGERLKKAKKSDRPKKPGAPRRGPGRCASRPLAPLLEEHAGRVVAAGGEPLRGLAPEVVVAGARAWTALLGLVSSELFGQLANTLRPRRRLLRGRGRGHRRRPRAVTAT
ncbi:MAG: hypothetical protein PGN11_12705 [Quadrisphaera sp.]